MSGRFRLQDAVALVTGGGSGIGRAICIRFAAEGAKVAVVDRDNTAAQAAATEVSRAGGSAVAIEHDIADVAAQPRVFDAIEMQFGCVTILVNNAGIGEHRPFLEVTPELWDRHHEINARGTFFLMQEGARRMIAAGRGGSIINVTSVVAERPWLHNTAYAASKAAVRIATAYAATELGPYGIRVNNLAPGPTDTPLSAPRYMDTDYRRDILNSVPLGRLGTPDDLANAALFLASDHASFITGVTLAVDGGRLTR